MVSFFILSDFLKIIFLKVCYQGSCMNSDLVLGPENENIKNSLLEYNCTVNPCLNGGTCVPVSLYFVCQCPNAYTGKELFKSFFFFIIV